MRPAAWLPLALAFVLAIPHFASAAGPRVALVVPGPGDDNASRLEARLRAELLISGFEVLTVARTDAVDQQELAQIADESGSFAAVSIVRSERWLGAEIWLSRSRGGSSVLHQVRPEPISHDGPAIVAIRAAEILRASAIDLRPPPAAPLPSASAAPPALASASAPLPSSPPPVLTAAPAAAPTADRGLTPPSPSEPVIAVTAALSAFGGPGGVPTGFGPTLALSYTFASVWSVELRGTGPVSSSINFDHGSADLDQELLAIDLRLDIDTGETLTPFIVLGGGAHRMGVRGQATPPHQPQSTSAWTAVALLETGLRLRASPRWAVRSALGAFYAVSRPVIAVDDQTLAYAARPEFHGTLGLELGW